MAGAGATSTVGRRPVVGDRVELSPDFAIHGDAGVCDCLLDVCVSVLALGVCVQAVGVELVR